MARSALTRIVVSGQARACNNAITSGWSLRHSMPTAPCPTAGKEISEASCSLMRSPISKRIKPAQARMIASYSPASNFAKRELTFPRRSLITKSGRLARSCAWRRKELVPTTAP